MDEIVKDIIIATIVPDDPARELLEELFGGGSSPFLTDYLNASLEEVTEENLEKVTSLRKYCFSSMPNLQSVTIPNNIQSIGNYCFSQCPDLVRVSIPASVTSLGAYAFSVCTNLEEVVIDSASSLTSIPESCFNSSKIRAADFLPSSVSTIGQSAFSDCQQLTTVVIPSSVYMIQSSAFANCSSLNSLTFLTPYVSIYHLAFQNCSSLTAINSPNTRIIPIGGSTFLGCSAIESITMIFDSFTSIQSLFGSAAPIPQTLKTITVCEGTTALISSAFKGCGGVTQITLPSTLTTIGEDAFYDYLGDIEIPKGVNSIGSRAFPTVNSITVSSRNVKYTAVNNCVIEKATNTIIAGCNNSVIPSDQNITKIGIAAFQDCSLIDSITLPSTVQEIEDGAFSGCTNLSSISLNNGLQRIGAGIFGALNTQTPCAKITSLIIPDTVASIDGIALAGCTNLASLTIPFTGAANSGSTTHLSFIFNGSSSASSSHVPITLKTITLSSVATSVAKNAFSNLSSVTTINLPNTITSIGASAFYKCTALTNVSIPSTVTSIGQSAFGYSGLKNATIPSGVTQLSASIFSNCTSLTSVSLPSNITQIQSSAFLKCSKLVDITYAGTMDQWIAIEKTSGWDNNTGNYTVHCTDGDIPKSV